jgi:hypothetical protein
MGRKVYRNLWWNEFEGKYIRSSNHPGAGWSPVINSNRVRA